MIDSASIRDLVTRFGGGATHRLSTCAGDQLLRFRWSFEAILSRASPDVLDVWSPANGDWVLMTNRTQDFPVWFELHPLEVAGKLVPWMNQKLEEGYQAEEPIDGPNIWRVQCGDRVVWTGPTRNDRQARDGVLEVFDFRASALVFGMSDTDPNPLRWMNNNDSAESLERARAALATVQSLGTPRVLPVSGEWTLG